MGSIHFTAQLDVSADVAWDYLDKFTRAEVLPFAHCVSGRMEGEYRVIGLADGSEVWERNVAADPARRRTTYTLDQTYGGDYHHAEMRVDAAPDGTASLTWVTDCLPHSLAEERAVSFAPLFDQLVAAVTAHTPGDR